MAHRHMRRLLRALAAALIALALGTGFAERLLVTSDLHLTADTAAHEPALNALAGAAAGFDVALLLGDNTNNAREVEHDFALRSLERLAGLSGAEVYVIPGNHDLDTRFRPGDFASRYAAYGWSQAFSRDETSASCAVMTRGGTCLVLLDTNAYGAMDTVEASGGVSAATIRWVETLLASLDPGTRVIACGHHPILPTGSRDRTANAGLLADALRAGGVRLYLCGHDHGFAAVSADGLQQITVGQPHAYPGWAGRLDAGAAGVRWRVLPLYTEDDPAWLAMAESAETLGARMARGTLEGTRYAGDEGAIAWFADCFGLVMRCELTDALCAALLADPNAQKWREIETRTVVKRWMFGLLENCPQDARDIWIPAP